MQHEAKLSFFKFFTISIGHHNMLVFFVIVSVIVKFVCSGLKNRQMI